MCTSWLGNFTPRHSTNRNEKKCSHKDYKNVHSGLFVIDKHCKLPNSTAENYIYITEYCSANKRNELLIQSTKTLCWAKKSDIKECILYNLQLYAVLEQSCWQWLWELNRTRLPDGLHCKRQQLSTGHSLGMLSGWYEHV